MERWILLKQWKLGKVNRDRSPRIINLPFKLCLQFHLRKKAQNQRPKILTKRTRRCQNRDKLTGKRNSLQDERLQDASDIWRLCTEPKTRLVSKLMLIHNVDARQPSNRELKQRRRRDDIDNTTKEYVL